MKRLQKLSLQKQTIFSLNYVDMFLRLSIQSGKNGFLIYACIMGRSIYGIPCCCQKRKKIKITEMCIPSNGEIVPADHACPGEIVVLADDTLKLNDILGNEKLLPHKTRIDNPMPLLRTTVEPQKPEQREALLNALAEIADTDPLFAF